MATLDANSAATSQSQWLSNQWHDRLGRLISGGKKSAVLAYLEQTIARSLPLFRSDPATFESRRTAWLIRAQLLLEWERPAEALAWTCLECQLAEIATGAAPPDARRLRDRLIRDLSLDFNPATAARIASESQWPGLAGMYELRASLERDLITVVRYPDDAARYGVVSPNGILLYGPPGCGKTFLARKIADKLGFHFIGMIPGDTPASSGGSLEVPRVERASPGASRSRAPERPAGATQAEAGPASLADVLAQAAAHTPAVLFLDELDLLTPPLATELAQFLDRCARQRILVIAATHYPDNLDPVLLRAGRLGQHYLVGLPDFAARAAIFRQHLEKRATTRLTWDWLAAQSEGYTAADIAYLCDQAARLALAESQRLLVWEDVLISPPHFETAMRNRKPSVAIERHTRIGPAVAQGTSHGA